MLSDGTIRRLLATAEIIVDPIDDSQIQPASIDVRLASEFLTFRNRSYSFIDPFDLSADLMERVTVPHGGPPFILHPGEFVLGSTIELVSLPENIVSRVEGKSSLGRIGLLIHATAGFIDPGFSGQVTLELSNVATLPILLRPGMRIGQLSFERLDYPAQRPYGHPGLGSKYNGQRGPVASRYRAR